MLELKLILLKMNRIDRYFSWIICMSVSFLVYINLLRLLVVALYIHFSFPIGEKQQPVNWSWVTLTAKQVVNVMVSVLYNPSKFYCQLLNEDGTYFFPPFLSNPPWG